MYCIITAGGLASPDDPMYTLTQGKPKALLAMNGRTMLERVVDALQSAQSVTDIIIVGLGSDMGMTFARPVTHLPDQGSLAGNVLTGCNWLHRHHPDEVAFISCTSDIPTLTPQIVDEFVASCRPFDYAVYYNLVTRDVMETRFPHSTRTFTKLKDYEVAGGDLNLARVEVILANEPLLQALTNARKHAWQIARVAGLRLIIKLLLRQLSLAEMQKEATRVLGHPVKVCLSPHAELGMDGDKPGQIELLRKEFV